MTADASGQARRQLGGALRRHLKLIGFLGLLGLIGGFAAGLVLPPRYTATSSVLVTPLDGNPYSPQGRGDDLINLVTEAQLVSTDAVGRIAQGKLRRGDAAQLRRKVTVSAPPNTQVLNISFTSDDRREARAGAQAFAEGYLEYRRQRTQSVADARGQKLREQQRSVQESQKNASRRLARAETGERGFLRQRVTAYNNQLGVIDEQINELNSTPINPGQVITPAAAPASQGITGPLMYGGGGLVAGLLLGFAIALVRERSDHRLHDARSLEHMGVPVLSVVPVLPETTEGLVLVTAPQGPAGEAYRRLRAAVIATVPQTPITLLVTSATPGVTATMASSNLAVALAHAGASTILIDAGNSGNEPAELFGLSRSKGLSDVLAGGTDPARLLVHADSQLRLLPRGADARDAAERFSGPRMRETVATVSSRADVVIINAPGVHDANAQALCTYADAILLVVTLGVTTREDVDQAYAEAERAGATVIGTVVERRTGRHGDLRERASRQDDERSDTWANDPLRHVTRTSTPRGAAPRGGAASGGHARGGAVRGDAPGDVTRRGAAHREERSAGDALVSPARDRRATQRRAPAGSSGGQNGSTRQDVADIGYQPGATSRPDAGQNAAEKRETVRLPVTRDADALSTRDLADYHAAFSPDAETAADPSVPEESVNETSQFAVIDFSDEDDLGAAETDDANADSEPAEESKRLH